MNFFCTKKHYDKWAADQALDLASTFCLNLEAAVDVARWLFGPRP